MSSTRVGFKGKAKMDAGWSAGTTVEVQMESNSSAKVNLLGDVNSGSESFTERKLELWVRSKAGGKFSIGQGSTASDGVAEADLSGTGVISGSGSGGALGADVRFVDPDGNTHSKVDGIFDNLDGHSRKDRLRYDSPSIGGFQISTSLQSDTGDGDSGPWDVALRYGRDLDGFEVEAIAAQWVNGDDTGMGGSASVLAPSGTSFTVAHTTEEDGDDSARMTYAKLGQKLDINPAGSTALSIGFMDAENADGDSGSAIDVAVVQRVQEPRRRVLRRLRRVRGRYRGRRDQRRHRRGRRRAHQVLGLRTIQVAPRGAARRDRGAAVPHGRPRRVGQGVSTRP